MLKQGNVKANCKSKEAKREAVSVMESTPFLRDEFFFLGGPRGSHAISLLYLLFGVLGHFPLGRGHNSTTDLLRFDDTIFHIEYISGIDQMMTYFIPSSMLHITYQHSSMHVIMIAPWSIRRKFCN